MSLFLRVQPICGQCMKGRVLLQLDVRGISSTPINALKALPRGITASSEQKCRHTDGVPNTYQLIYRAPFETYIKLAKATTSTSASLIAAICCYKWLFTSQFLPITTDLNIDGLVSHESDIWWFAGGFIGINMAVRYFVAKYPLRIYRHEEQYFAIYDSQLPLMSRKIHSFARGDVAAIQQFFNPWSHIMYRLGNRTSLLLVNYFKSPNDYNYMFGLK